MKCLLALIGEGEIVMRCLCDCLFMCLSTSMSLELHVQCNGACCVCVCLSVCYSGLMAEVDYMILDEWYRWIVDNHPCDVDQIG